jgi:hypothetical protein
VSQIKVNPFYANNYANLYSVDGHHTESTDSISSRIASAQSSLSGSQPNNIQSQELTAKIALSYATQDYYSQQIQELQQQRQIVNSMSADGGSYAQERLVKLEVGVQLARSGLSFWNAESQHMEKLQLALNANPNVFDGKPEEAALFKALLDQRTDLNNQHDMLLSFGADVNSSEYASGEQAKSDFNLSQNCLQLQALAQGMSVSELQSIQEPAAELMKNNTFWSAATVDYYNQTGSGLENMRNVTQDAVNSNPADANSRASLVDINQRMFSNNKVKDFWKEQDQNDQYLRELMAENPKALLNEQNRENFTGEFSNLSDLRNQMDTLLNQDGFNTSMSRRQKSRLEKQIQESTQRLSDLLGSGRNKMSGEEVLQFYNSDQSFKQAVDNDYNYAKQQLNLRKDYIESSVPQIQEPSPTVSQTEEPYYDSSTGNGE